jgi:hypothetical protein
MNKFKNADELLDSVKNEGLIDLNEGAEFYVDKFIVLIKQIINKIKNIL